MPNAYTLLEPPDGQFKNGPEGGSRTAREADPSRARSSLEPKTTDDPAGHPPSAVKVEGRNLGFDALAAACGVDSRNRKRASETATALRDIRGYVWDDVPEDDRAAMQAEPERFERHLAAAIPPRAEAYLRHPKLRTAMLTPLALAKWWHDVGPTSQARGSGFDRLPDL